MFALALAAALALLLVLASSPRLRAKRSRAQLPPGPRAWPLIGNIRGAIGKGVWTTFTEYKHTYGNYPVADRCNQF